MTRCPIRRHRAGFSLIEIVAAVTLSATLLLFGVALLIRLEAAFRSSVDRLEFLETARIGVDRVDRIVRGGGLDPARPAGPDGLPHRAWRGSAAWCGDGWIEFPVRQPDPARDSIWWVDAFGAIRVEKLKHREGGGCGGAGARLRVEHPTDSGSVQLLEGGVVRWFERGRLRVDDAVRYGREGAPAQPLTPAVLGPGQGIEEVSTGGGGLRLVVESVHAGSRERVPPVARRWWRR